MMRGKEYKLEKDLNTKLSQELYSRYFQESKKKNFFFKSQID